jgi:hypothetical protein
MKTSEGAPKRCWLCSPCVLVAVLGGASILLLGRLAYVVSEKVFTGAGDEFCCTIDGYRFTYLAVFVVGASYVAVILAATGYALYDWWQWRSVEQRYRRRAA